MRELIHSDVFGIIWLVLVLAMIFIQIYLSLKRNKILGLIIPGVLLCAIICVAIETTINYNSRATSFPLDGLIFINSLMFLVPLIMYVTIYIICLFIKKKRKK